MLVKMRVHVLTVMSSLTNTAQSYTNKWSRTWIGSNQANQIACLLQAYEMAKWPDVAAEEGGIQLADDTILVFHSVDARQMLADFPSEQECRQSFQCRLHFYSFLNLPRFAYAMLL